MQRRLAIVAVAIVATHVSCASADSTSDAKQQFHLERPRTHVGILTHAKETPTQDAKIRSGHLSADDDAEAVQTFTTDGDTFDLALNSFFSGKVLMMSPAASGTLPVFARSKLPRRITPKTPPPTPASTAFSRRDVSPMRSRTEAQRAPPSLLVRPSDFAPPMLTTRQFSFERNVPYQQIFQSSLGTTPMRRSPAGMTQKAIHAAVKNEYIRIRQPPNLQATYQKQSRPNLSISSRENSPTSSTSPLASPSFVRSRSPRGPLSNWSPPTSQWRVSPAKRSLPPRVSKLTTSPADSWSHPMPMAIPTLDELLDFPFRAALQVLSLIRLEPSMTPPFNDRLKHRRVSILDSIHARELHKLCIRVGKGHDSSIPLRAAIILKDLLFDDLATLRDRLASVRLLEFYLHDKHFTTELIPQVHQIQASMPFSMPRPGYMQIKGLDLTKFASPTESTWLLLDLIGFSGRRHSSPVLKQKLNDLFQAKSISAAISGLMKDLQTTWHKTQIDTLRRFVRHQMEKTDRRFGRFVQRASMEVIPIEAIIEILLQESLSPSVSSRQYLMRCWLSYLVWSKHVHDVVRQKDQSVFQNMQVSLAAKQRDVSSNTQKTINSTNLRNYRPFKV